MSSAATTEVISGPVFYRRLVRKLARPRVLRAMIRLQRLSDAEVDSLGAVIARRAASDPDGPALRFEDESYTWSQINAWANRYAHAFRDEGIGKGDVIALDMQNRPAFIAVLTAAHKLGAAVALLNTSLTGDALGSCIQVAGAKLMVIGEEQVGAVSTVPAEALPPRLFFVADGAASTAPERYEDLDAIAAEASDNDLPETTGITLGDTALYVYTSGTTGLPKAATNTHRRLFMAGLFSGIALRELKPGDVVYSPLPLYHVSSLLGGWISCAFTGATFALARRFSASQFWLDAKKHDATTVTYMGELARYLMNQPPSPADRDHRVRSMMGAGIRHDLWVPFKERFGLDAIYEVYGGTETPAGFVNLLNFDRSCGWLPRGWATVECDVETGEPVRGEDGFARKVSPGGVGLLLMEITAHQKFEGYTDREATEKKILRDVFKQGDTWFSCGDLMLNQGHGHARFVDRLGDTLRWKAENVATTQVEGVINRWRQVQDVVVYGVQVPGYEGRAGMARLFLTPGEELDVTGLAAHLRGLLPEYAVPRFFRVSVDAADLTGTFKHKKAELKAEGFDPAKFRDEAYVLIPGSDTIVPLTDELVSRIVAGGVRL